jgi:hypothetical protein
VAVCTGEATQGGVGGKVDDDEKIVSLDRKFYMHFHWTCSTERVRLSTRNAPWLEPYLAPSFRALLLASFRRRRSGERYSYPLKRSWFSFCWLSSSRWLLAWMVSAPRVSSRARCVATSTDEDLRLRCPSSSPVVACCSSPPPTPQVHAPDVRVHGLRPFDCPWHAHGAAEDWQLDR